MVHDIFSWDSLMFKLRKNVSRILVMCWSKFLKKCRTLTLKLCCKGPNYCFFIYFVLLFWGGCPWYWCMIYFSWDSLTFKLRKKCVTDIGNVLDIILKSEHLSFGSRVQIIVFFLFCSPILRCCPWNWCMIYIFFILWRLKYGKNVSRLLVLCWT